MISEATHARSLGIAAVAGLSCALVAVIAFFQTRLWALAGLPTIPPRSALSSIHEKRAAQPARVLRCSIGGGTPALIDLGTIVAGGRAEAPLWLANDSDSPIDIGRVRTNCPCIRVELDERRIGRHQRVRATVQLDLSDDPEFTGGLCPEFCVLDSVGRERLTCTAHAAVVSKSISHTVVALAEHVD